MITGVHDQFKFPQLSIWIVWQTIDKTLMEFTYSDRQLRVSKQNFQSINLFGIMQCEDDTQAS